MWWQQVYVYMLFSCLSCLTSGQLFYITPRPDAGCNEHHSCYTFQRFFGTVTPKVNSTITLYFLPGDYNISAPQSVNIRNITALSMTSPSSNTKIICGHFVSFTFTNISSVRIENLTFYGFESSSLPVRHTAAIQIQQVNIFIVHSSVFNHFKGRIIDALQSNITISRSVFNSSAEIVKANLSIVTIADSSFMHNEAGFREGIIYAYKTTMKINRNCFTQNYVGYEGVLLKIELSNLIMINTTISNNEAAASKYFYSARILAVHNSSLEIHRGFHFTFNIAGYTDMIHTYNSEIKINLGSFTDNIVHAGGVLVIEQSKLIISNTTIANNKADRWGIVARNSMLEIYHGFHCTSNIVRYQYSLIHIYKSGIKINRSSFTYNFVNRGVLVVIQSKFIIGNTTIANNIADNWSPILDAQNSLLEINHGLYFIFNVAIYGMIHTYNSEIKINRSSFAYNFVRHFGVLVLEQSNFTISNTTIANNEAGDRGILIVHNNTVEGHHEVHGLHFIGNRARLYTFNVNVSNVDFTGGLVFTNNSGTLQIRNSQVTFSGLSSFSNCTGANIQESEQGGAITSIQSILHIAGSSEFHENFSWKRGGAISASNSRVYMKGEVVIANNRASKSGGGIYLYKSELICTNNCTFSGNRATESGGAIYALESLIGRKWSQECEMLESATSSLFLFNNQAKFGGGISLKNSQLYSLNKIRIEFNNNSAEKGGAVYVEDENSPTCYSNFEDQYFDCSIYISQGSSIKLNDNSTLYGGLLDRCTIPGTVVNAVESLRDVINHENTDSASHYFITSEPVRVCYCNGTQIDCDYEHPGVIAERGKEFKVTLVAVDQVNQPLNATIRISLNAQEGYLLEGQQIKHTTSMCTNLTFNVYSPLEYVELTLYANGPCKNQGISQTILQVYFTNCTCPAGFNSQVDKNNCQCSCDPRIMPYVTMCNLSSVVTDNDIWIGFNKSTGFLVSKSCPYDYCNTAHTDTVGINLNIFNGSDAQCTADRTGLLCAACKPGFSLSLDSSHCLPCQRDWSRLFPVIVMGAVIAGIALVAMTLVLNLTVAVGTMNGLIFYVNIVSANANSLLPFSKPTFPSIFIAWLNLDLGLDTCFSGTNEYIKAWLQLAFPFYLIALVVIIIASSKCSQKFAKLIGKGNPVATLGTLILLSYTKLLRTAINIFSFAILYHYPSGAFKVVWLPDANIKYFEGKHIPLFLAAVVIVTVGLAYTILLFSWQWFLRAPNKTIFRWIGNTRLNMFMEANLAPYKARYRYWTGLLLFIRIALYFGIALDESHKNRVSLLATSLMVASLFLLKSILGTNVYRKRFIDCINSLFLINLLMFCLVSQYFRGANKQGQKTLAHISVSIAFIALVCILFYHIIITILGIRYHNSTIGYSIKTVLKSNSVDDLHIKLFHYNIETQVKGLATPTTTEVGLSDSIQYSAEGTTKEEETIPKHSGKSASTEHYCNSTPMSDPTLALAAAGIKCQKDSSPCHKQPNTKRSKSRQWDKLRESLLQD